MAAKRELIEPSPGDKRYIRARRQGAHRRDRRRRPVTCPGRAQARQDGRQGRSGRQRRSRQEDLTSTCRGMRTPVHTAMTPDGGTMHDRIADPWGPRTPYGAGVRNVGRRNRMAGSRRSVPGVGSHGEDDVDRWVQTASVLHSNGDAFDFAVRDGAIVGVRGRADDRVNRGRLGPKDLFGWQAITQPTGSTRPLVRAGRLVETDWDTAMGTIVERPQGVARRARRVGADRLLHLRPAGAGGLLHARRHREGGHRHAAHGRQHPAVHGDRGVVIEGVVRDRRTARVVHGRRSLRRARPVGSQRRRDADGAVGADARPAGRRRTRRDCWLSTRVPHRSPEKPTSISRHATAPTSR